MNFREGTMCSYTVLQLEEDVLCAMVTMEDLLDAAAHVTPSVSAEEMRHYDVLRQQFSSLACHDSRCHTSTWRHTQSSHATPPHDGRMQKPLNGTANGSATWLLKSSAQHHAHL
jgi:hypothetical protein